MPAIRPIPDGTLPETLLTLAERHKLLVEWNATAADYPRDKCLHQLFEEQVALASGAVAVTFRDGRLTYGELNGRANQLSSHLRRQGVGRSDRVGVYVERSLEMMVTLLGVQKSGATYVPLDPEYPGERIRLALEQAAVKMIISNSALAAAFPSPGPKMVLLDSDWPRLAQEPAENHAPNSGPDDLIYVIFTSGSTGRPKGVQVAHKAVVNLLTFMGQQLAMGPDDVFPALASFAFDMCIPELYLALLTGGTVAICERETASDAEALARWLEQTRSTVLHATPTTWRMLLDAGYTAKGLKRAVGAEPLPQELCNSLLEAGPSLYHFYGPTETTVWSTMHLFRAPGEQVTLGRPIANTRIYLLDHNQQLVPTGMEGEICIAGEGVAAGYLNQPELTAAKFPQDPFTDAPRQKMYCTGDLGRYLPDGRLEFLGRRDQQVKIRGFRVELGEIESFLQQQSGVERAVAAVHEDFQGDKRIIAYVVPRAGASLDRLQLREALKQNLPSYMLPAAIMVLESIPVLPNGKLNRNALPPLDFNADEEDYRAPHNQEEEILCGLFADVLGLQRVGTEDDLFALGGHSLTATRLAGRIRKTFGIDLPVRALFEAPTPKALAPRLRRHHCRRDALKRHKRPEKLACSFGQQRFWFIDQLQGSSAEYNVGEVLRLRGMLDRDALERAINTIVERHESLRTHFEVVEDEPLQVIETRLRIELREEDLRGLEETERHRAALRTMEREVEERFDLSCGPLLRTKLLKLGEEEHVLLRTIHHVACDGWSEEVFNRELQALYVAYAQGEPSPLTELEIQYPDYALWQRRWAEQGGLEDDLKYWKEELAGIPERLLLSEDRPRGALQTFVPGVWRQKLGPELTAELRRVGRENGVTLYMTLLAGLAVVLSRYSGQEDVVIGTPIANREDERLEGMIGFFVNTLAMRVRVRRETSFRDLLGEVRQTALNAYEHQQLPFEILVKELSPERSQNGTRIFDAQLVMQNAPLSTVLPGLVMEPMEVSHRQLRSHVELNTAVVPPLSVVAVEHGNWVDLTWVYNRDMFDHWRVEQMAGHHARVIEALAKG
ncbi:MAG: amino acid adenylation domain-containing protein [Acidobacteriia bacterium]|nr:amino acid adenylation domain-containing protein [Terriglobia bacterium]